jgi:hypothetical protein
LYGSDAEPFAETIVEALDSTGAAVSVKSLMAVR